MTNSHWRFMIVFSFVGAVCVLGAADAVIGSAAANGPFRINDARVDGNATVFAGSLIETAASGSTIRLASGPGILLGSETRAVINRDGMVLESGAAEFSTTPEFPVSARSIQIVPDSATGTARVEIDSEKAFRVTPLEGEFRLLNSRGTLLAMALPGTTLSVEPGPAQDTPSSSFIGCLLKREDKFIIFDETTRIVVELKGDDAAFSRYWGQKVQANGTTDTNAESSVGAAQVVNVSGIQSIGAASCETVAAQLGFDMPEKIPVTGTTGTGSTSGGAASGGGGVSSGVIIAIVLAAAGGGIGAALALSGGDSRSN